MQDGGKSRFEQIGEYYEDTATRCWEIACQGHQHSGYWDESNRNGEPWEGPLRLTELMIDWTPVARDQRLIDFGSGFGLPAIELAKRTGCSVEGVNASRYQTAKAVAAAEAEGLAERVRFHVQDALHLPYEDGSFDGGWFFESIFHMGHAAALAEARRVLKPGATLLITDFVNHENTSQEFLDLQREVLLAEHGDAAAYPRLLAEAGFEPVEMLDLTEPAIIRGAARNSDAFSLYREEMLELAGDDYLPFVQEVADLFAKNAGYLFVKARAI